MLKKLIMFAAVAGLALAPAPAARADPLTGPGGVMAPTGAHPVLPRDWGVGDKYHLAFVSSSTHDAVSTDINVYNAWVQSQADAAGSIVKSAGAITWKAICSTSGMDAKDNTNISAPVYLVDPTAPILLAVDAADMWDGNIGHKFAGT